MNRHHSRARLISLARWQTLGHFALDMPLLVGGDWNSPSHLDWTAATGAAFPHRRGLPLPVSTLMHEQGFLDTIRAVHPDLVRMPGCRANLARSPATTAP